MNPLAARVAYWHQRMVTAKSERGRHRAARELGLLETIANGRGQRFAEVTDGPSFTCVLKPLLVCLAAAALTNCAARHFPEPYVFRVSRQLFNQRFPDSPTLSQRQSGFIIYQVSPEADPTWLPDEWPPRIRGPGLMP